ncbi:MAG: hypothetical protein DWQ06_03725 [Calditrichaeota bacterium]|nr:MAG: hypothetical protein DWQ06_03725 [Calditrichota bacterium]
MNNLISEVRFVTLSRFSEMTGIPIRTLYNNKVKYPRGRGNQSSMIDLWAFNSNQKQKSPLPKNRGKRQNFLPRFKKGKRDER